MAGALAFLLLKKGNSWKNTKYGHWKNKEAEECVLHMLSTSGEVRKRTHLAFHDTVTPWIQITQGGIEMKAYVENKKRDQIEENKN